MPHETYLSEAYQIHHKGLLHYATARVHDSALAEDIVSETFLKAWNYIAKGGTVTLMKAFLYHIMNCLIVDHYRKQKTVSLDLLFENGFEPALDESSRLIDSLDGKHALQLVPQLPPKYRSVVSLRYIRNLSIKEIAAKTHQSENTVVVQIHRGLRKIKSLYESTRYP